MYFTYCSLRCFKSQIHSTYFVISLLNVNATRYHSCWLSEIWSVSCFKSPASTIFCDKFANFRITRDHGLRTPHLSAGMLVRWNICTYAACVFFILEEVEYIVNGDNPGKVVGCVADAIFGQQRITKRFLRCALSMRGFFFFQRRARLPVSLSPSMCSYCGTVRFVCLETLTVLTVLTVLLTSAARPTRHGELIYKTK